MANNMITFSSKGSFKNSLKFLHFLSEKAYLKKLDQYGKMGVEALEKATPKDTGLTANSWDYQIIEDYQKESISITWTNSNMTKYNIPVAILLQMGHATKNGGYVQGIDYINPALKPVFDEITEKIWKEVEDN